MTHEGFVLTSDAGQGGRKGAEKDELGVRSRKESPKTAVAKRKTPQQRKRKTKSSDTTMELMT